MLCSTIRNVKYVNSKLVGIEILVYLSKYVSDWDKLHIVLPFVCNLLDD